MNCAPPSAADAAPDRKGRFFTQRFETGRAGEVRGPEAF